MIGFRFIKAPQQGSETCNHMRNKDICQKRRIQLYSRTMAERGGGDKKFGSWQGCKSWSPHLCLLRVFRILRVVISVGGVLSLWLFFFWPFLFLRAPVRVHAICYVVFLFSVAGVCLTQRLQHRRCLTRIENTSSSGDSCSEISRPCSRLLEQNYKPPSRRKKLKCTKGRESLLNIRLVISCN